MYTMRLRESTLANQIKEQKMQEERLVAWKSEITTLNSSLKVCCHAASDTAVLKCGL